MESKRFLNTLQIVAFAVGALALIAALGLVGCGAPASDINGDVPQDPPVAAGMVLVESIEILILESFPVQVHVLVKGSLPDGCTEVVQINQRRDLENNTFWVEITTVRPTNVEYTMKDVPFEDTIPLDVYGLPAGDYTVDVNGVSGTFTLYMDNVPQEGATDDAPEGALSVSELEQNPVYDKVQVYGQVSLLGRTVLSLL